MLRKTRPFLIVAALALLVLGSAMAAGGPSEKQTIEGREVVIFNLAGSVTIENYDGDMVQVEVTRGGSDAAKIQVETDIDFDTKIGYIRFITPSTQVVYPEAAANNQSIFVRGDGTFFPGHSGNLKTQILPEGNGLNAWADLKVLVPKNVSLVMNLGTGRIDARGMVSPLKIAGINGQVNIVDHSGGLKVNTMAAAVSIFGGRGEVNVATKTGNITLDEIKTCKTRVFSEYGQISASFAQSADLKARTKYGKIDNRTKFGLSEAGRLVEGVFGDGQAHLDLKTITGNITLSSL